MKEKLRRHFNGVRTEAEIKAAIAGTIYGSDVFEAAIASHYYDDMLSYAQGIVRHDADLEGELGAGDQLTRKDDADIVPPLEGDDQAFTGEPALEEEELDDVLEDEEVGISDVES